MNLCAIFTLLLSPSVYSFATIPSSSSRQSMASTSIHNIMSSDIAVVGCGVLGTSLCKQLLSSPDFKGKSVTGITKTKNNHESIENKILGSDSDASSSINTDQFQLRTFDEMIKQKQFDNVVFCAPPSGFDDYPAAVQNVIDTLWAGPENGVFVFTSSGGIYGPGNGETVTETTELPPAETPRTRRLIKAELNTIAAGGCVLRLAGLYTLERGAHKFWLEKSNGSVGGQKDGIINLLHYDDAAGSCIAALRTKQKDAMGKVFLISDGNPTTRIGICESALKSSRYSGLDMPTFGEGDSAEKGKIYDGHWSNEVLGWKPVYNSFDDFMVNSQ